MIAIKPIQLENVMEVVVKGKVYKNDIETFEHTLQEKKGQHDRLNLLLSIEEVTDYTLKAFLEDFKMSARHWEDFHKIAVFSDKKWIELSAKMSKYIPGVEVKHFEFSEKEEALVWFER